MRAAYIESFDAEHPASVVRVGERPDPEPPHGWTVVEVRAAALNHHDVWSCRGVGLRDEYLPMILGCDAAGVDPDGNEVIVHGVINDPSWSGDEALDPKMSLFSERYQGTFAQALAVPKANLIPKPEALSFAEAACLPTAWLTAYRMLFTQAAAKPGDTILAQGATGGVATALVTLGTAAGIRMWVTSRTEQGRDLALKLGADAVFEPGARLPERVDAVMDSSGAATWTHSLGSLRKGGIMVVVGGTGGYTAEASVARIFALNLRIAGSTMGTRDELRRLARFCVDRDLRPLIDRVVPLTEAADAIGAMEKGGLSGKIVFEP